MFNPVSLILFPIFYSDSSASSINSKYTVYDTKYYVNEIYYNALTDRLPIYSFNIDDYRVQVLYTLHIARYVPVINGVYLWWWEGVSSVYLSPSSSCYLALIKYVLLYFILLLYTYIPNPTKTIKKKCFVTPFPHNTILVIRMHAW